MADTDSVLAYQQTLERLTTARTAVESLVGPIRKIADLLAKWREIRRAEDICYPSMTEFQERWDAWQRARKDAESAWTAIPRNRKIGLKEPAEFA